MTNDSFSYEIHSITFPKNHSDEWRKLFQPCASERLFLPVSRDYINHAMLEITIEFKMFCFVFFFLLQSVLSHLDSILYVDTDTIFLNNVEDVWRHFSLMNSTQLAAMVPEHEDLNVGWYNRFAKHPYYGKLGEYFCVKRIGTTIVCGLLYLDCSLLLDKILTES